MATDCRNSEGEGFLFVNRRHGNVERPENFEVGFLLGDLRGTVFENRLEEGVSG